MTKNSTKLSEEAAYELLVAEEELILHAQMLIVRALRESRITQKQLADRLGVGESYVSQMLGTSARNLTLRTIARVMAALDLKATLVLDEHVEASAAEEEAQTGAEDAKAVASRLAASRLSQVWGEVVALPPRAKSRRRHDADAEAYAAYDPPVREMEEMALAA